jgi:hypothetical protein
MENSADRLPVEIEITAAVRYRISEALVAQLDRAPDFESGGREFESLRARQLNN